MSFSVIAANYNKEHFLESFFDSFIGISEHIEYELIFIDDGSIDRSIQIADSYKCQLPLKIISLEKNQGPATARNIGIREATHSTIIFCDTDIAFKPSVLLEGYKLFLENNYDVLTFNLDILPLTKTTMGRVYLLEEWENLEVEKTQSGPHRYFTTTLSIVKREWFNTVGPFDESFKGADIEDLILGFKTSRETRFWFSKELTFRHAYPSNSLVLKKAFTRAFQLGQLSVKDMAENPILDNSFRKFCYFISCLWILCLILVMTSLMSIKIFIYLTVAEIFIHYKAYLLGIKNYGLFFSFGLFFGRLIYVLSASTGFVLGKVYPKKAV
jgi:glycosyltransferase involved in cell wall biosynthesis